LDWTGLNTRVGRESVGWGHFNNEKQNVKGRIKPDVLCVFIESIYKVPFAKYLERCMKNHKAKYLKNLDAKPACPSIHPGSGGEPGTRNSLLISRLQQQENCVCGAR